MISKLKTPQLLEKLYRNIDRPLPDELRKYKSEVLTINELKVPRNLFLYFPDNKRISQAKKELVSLYKVMQKLIKYIIFEEPDLLKVIDKEGIDYEALRKKAPETLLGYARVDTIFGDDKFRVVEFNSRRPQMYEDADFYGKYIAGFVGEENIIQEENGLHLMKSIETQFQTNIKRKTPETIIVINNFPNQQYSFSSINRIKNYFKDSEVIVLKCEDLKGFYEEIKYTKGALKYLDKKIDLILIQSVCGKNSLYNANGRIKNKAILDAYHDNQVELYTSPSGQISGTKLSLDLLQDYEMQIKLGLSDEEIRFIKLIPNSIHSNNIEDLSEYNKDDYVLKLTGLGQGMGVKMGVDMTQKEWKETFAKSKKKNKPFLLQQKINLSKEEIFDLQTLEMREAYITLEPFVINDLSNSNDPYISGFATRAIPLEKYKNGMKFNPAFDNQNIYFGAIVEEA